MALRSRWLSRPRTPVTDRGERIYAIGDVHGRYDLLRFLLNEIEAHNDSLPPTHSVHVLLLGDLIDRGPDSAKVLEFVRRAQHDTDRLIALQGNHEQMMLRVLAGEPRVLRPWLRMGGDATLRSFGLEPPPRDMDEALFALQLAREMPPGLADWIRQLPLTARSGDYFFCHAGIRPGVPLKRQSRSDLLWIRDEFLGDPADHGAVIVHGHSIAAEVEMLPNRIGIDTGAYRTDILTALYVEDAERAIIATRPATVA